MLVPANTPSSAPITTDISVLDGLLQRVEVTVPDGHNGLTGIQILAAEAQLLPATFGTYLVANDQTITVDTVGVIDTGSFQAKCFNGGVFNHTFYVRLFMLDFAQVAQPSTPAAPTTVPVVV